MGSIHFHIYSTLVVPVVHDNATDETLPPNNPRNEQTFFWLFRSGGWKKLGIGSALIIVTDLEGIVIDCRIMSGVTVFSEFKKIVSAS
ncbi:hypothetical protein GCM10020331_013170 [Ectobacillus funiculus]